MNAIFFHYRHFVKTATIYIIRLVSGYDYSIQYAFSFVLDVFLPDKIRYSNMHAIFFNKRLLVQENCMETIFQFKAHNLLLAYHKIRINVAIFHFLIIIDN